MQAAGTHPAARALFRRVFGMAKKRKVKKRKKKKTKDELRALYGKMRKA